MNQAMHCFLQKRLNKITEVWRETCGSEVLHVDLSFSRLWLSMKIYSPTESLFRKFVESYNRAVELVETLEEYDAMNEEINKILVSN